MHRDQVETLLTCGANARDPTWTESIAVGSEAFAEKVRSGLGPSKRHRTTRYDPSRHALREEHPRYTGRIQAKIPL